MSTKYLELVDFAALVRDLIGSVVYMPFVAPYLERERRSSTSLKLCRISHSNTLPRMFRGHMDQ